MRETELTRVAATIKWDALAGSSRSASPSHVGTFVSPHDAQSSRKRQRCDAAPACEAQIMTPSRAVFGIASHEPDLCGISAAQPQRAFPSVQSVQSVHTLPAAHDDLACEMPLFTEL